MEATYEVEAYQSCFKDSETASKWIEAKRKLLEDAGLSVVQYSLYEAYPGQFNANIQASRGQKPGGPTEPAF